MAEDINIGSDQLLTTGLAADDRVILTKAATGQQVASMTASGLAAALRPMIRDDYTSTGEWAVPGEFWPALSGSGKKQVYCRTFTGTFPSQVSGSYLELVLATNIENFSVVSGQLTSSSVTSFDAVWLTANRSQLRIYNSNLEFVIYSDTSTSVLGKPFMFTIKYTKR